MHASPHEACPSVAELLELAKLIRCTRQADEELRALLDHYDAGALSMEALKDALRALAVRHGEE